MFGSRMFPGGVHPHESVNGKSVNGGNAIVKLPAPPRVIIPLSQHIGAPAVAIVKKGDKVTANQMIAKPQENALSVGIHSPINGTVAQVNDKNSIITA